MPGSVRAARCVMRDVHVQHDVPCLRFCHRHRKKRKTWKTWNLIPKGYTIIRQFFFCYTLCRAKSVSPHQRHNGNGQGTKREYVRSYFVPTNLHYCCVFQAYVSAVRRVPAQTCSAFLSSRIVPSTLCSCCRTSRLESWLVVESCKMQEDAFFVWLLNQGR